MKAGVLLITHGSLGSDLLNTAMSILDRKSIAAEAIAVHHDSDPEAVYETASQACNRLDTGAGVLVLTDLFGSTPSNIANRLIDRQGVIVISGVNLPMLLRIMNYPTMHVEQLADKATSGAHDGVVLTKRKQAS
ncbi:MAG: PTS fructose transporter subunit IIA [Gammaproteobacteria bacterium]|jgi:PTS system ascorbate-specific IIA component